MIRKYCPYCREYSYSSSSANPWYCAKCAADLSLEPVLAINERAPKDCSIRKDYQEVNSGGVEKNISY
ncbi:MAG TPA: hypothetical protein GXX46_10040 [Peptococcaceae bacterium]|nr:hypothetical protein [Peptococcaceae bacterium]